MKKLFGMTFGLSFMAVSTYLASLVTQPSGFFVTARNLASQPAQVVKFDPQGNFVIPASDKRSPASKTLK